MDEFIENAIEAGFSRKEAEFMDNALAKFPHSHDVSDVEGLEGALEELGVDVDEMGEEDEE